MFQNPRNQAKRTHKVAEGPKYEDGSNKYCQKDDNHEGLKFPEEKLKRIKIIVDTHTRCEYGNQKSNVQQQTNGVAGPERNLDLKALRQRDAVGDFLSGTYRADPPAEEFVSNDSEYSHESQNREKDHWHCTASMYKKKWFGHNADGTRMYAHSPGKVSERKYENHAEDEKCEH